ncbi:MAG: DNA repair protein RecO [Pseudomonadales bacterium]|jgi:DNA repair protein RecO|nr:DNA repair protein RecO [Pseudomonadales bacterium]
MQNKQRGSNYQALVIKSKKMGESDLLVTLLCQELGKITVLAKGARKLNSSKKAYLEGGNLVTVFLIQTKSMPILTQAKLLADIGEIRFNFNRLRRLWEFLEMVDQIMIEEELEMNIFRQILLTRELIVGGHNNGLIKQNLTDFLYKMGIIDENENVNQSLSSQVANFTGKKMLTFEYLTLER